MPRRFLAIILMVFFSFAVAGCAPRIRDTNTAARDAGGALIGGALGAVVGRGAPVAIATGAIAGAVVTDYLTNPSPPYVQPGANTGYDYDNDIVITTGYQYYTYQGGIYRYRESSRSWSVWYNGNWGQERPYGPPQHELRPYRPHHHHHNGGPRVNPPQQPQQGHWNQRPYPSAPAASAAPATTPATPPKATPVQPQPTPAAAPPAPAQPRPTIQPLFPKPPQAAPAPTTQPDTRQRVRIIDPANVPPHAQGQ